MFDINCLAQPGSFCCINLLIRKAAAAPLPPSLVSSGILLSGVDKLGIFYADSSKTAIHRWVSCKMQDVPQRPFDSFMSLADQKLSAPVRAVRSPPEVYTYIARGGKTKPEDLVPATALGREGYVEAGIASPRTENEWEGTGFLVRPSANKL